MFNVLEFKFMLIICNLGVKKKYSFIYIKDFFCIRSSMK